MPTGDALWMNADAGAPSYDATELRRLDTPLMWPTTGLGTRPGIRPGATAVSLAGQVVTVKPCSGISAPSATPWTTTDGPYRWALLGGTHTLTPAATSPRIDRLVLRIEDDDVDGTGQRRAITVLIDGTPAAIPVAAETGPGDLTLATVLVPANGSPAPALTYSPDYFVAVGGILPVPTRANLPTTGLYDGMAAYITDEQTLAICHAGAWSAAGNRNGYMLWQTLYLTASTTFVKANYPGLKGVKVKCQGGGGGGGGTATTTAAQASCSGGGAGGAYAERFVAAANLGATETVTVGGAGAGGAADARGATGGTSSFGAHCIAPGGDGGFNRNATAKINASSGASPTTGGTGSLVIPGGGGGAGIAFAGATDSSHDDGVYGTGGSSALGGSGRGARGASTAPATGANWGSGGSGNVCGPSTAGKPGGAGGPGIVIIEIYV